MRTLQPHDRHPGSCYLRLAHTKVGHWRKIHVPIHNIHNIHNIHIIHLSDYLHSPEMDNSPSSPPSRQHRPPQISHSHPSPTSLQPFRRN